MVKGDRASSPIREHTSSLEFFNIKEQRYLQHMQKFRNGDRSYAVSHPIAMALIDPSFGNGTTQQEFYLRAKRIPNDPPSKHCRIRQLRCEDTG
jgi:hypothetical protein